MYCERPSSLDGGIVWSRTAAGACRVLPDGCMDLIWDADTLVIAGPDTQAHIAPSTADTITGLRFAPGAGPDVLGVDAHELRDQRVPLDQVWAPADVRRLVDQVGTAPDPGRMLEAESAIRVREADPSGTAVAGLLPAIVRALRRGTPITTVADSVGLSERQLHRRCLAAFGYGPKTLARVLRMHGALRFVGMGVPFAEVAVRSGYADQAHMAREVKALAGVPLSDLT